MGEVTWIYLVPLLRHGSEYITRLWLLHTPRVPEYCISSGLSFNSNRNLIGIMQLSCLQSRDMLVLHRVVNVHPIRQELNL
jgi:hypothetical protein